MLESARVYDNSDNDQTGMRLYTLDGILITAAWGQDPANSLGGAPYLDLGTTVLPFPIASVEKTSASVVDENSNGLMDWGDTLEYTITVNNDGVMVLGGVVASTGCRPVRDLRARLHHLERRTGRRRYRAAGGHRIIPWTRPDCRCRLFRPPSFRP